MFLKYGVKRDNMVSNLTVVILTKNEEMNIVDVIANAKQVTDKVLIVDSGSTDKTVELAKKNGAKVVYRAWDNDFAAQRNFALEHVDTEWVLYLDADERMNEELCKGIVEIVHNNVQKQYYMRRKVFAFGFEYRYGAFRPDKVLRMFPSKLVMWKNKVHEHPECALPKEQLDGFMKHYTYSSWQQWWDKAGNYTSIWANDVYDRGKRVSMFAPLSHSLGGFLKVYVLQLGFLDGWAGLYSSFQHFIYTLMKYLKLLELQRCKQKVI